MQHTNNRYTITFGMATSSTYVDWSIWQERNMMSFVLNPLSSKYFEKSHLIFAMSKSVMYQRVFAQQYHFNSCLPLGWGIKSPVCTGEYRQSFF